MNKKKVLALLLTFSLATTTLAVNVTSSTVKAASGQTTTSGSVISNSSSRINGSDRYETAAKVAVENWTTPENVVLVSGEGYADAISASVLAKKLNAPILLTTPQTLNSYTKTALDTLKPKNIYVVGGGASISKEVKESLKGSYSVVELSGSNRYETNVAVAKKLVELGVDPSNVILVGGEGFSDALTVASIAAAKGQILLLGSNNLDYIKPITRFINEHKSSVTVVAANSVINDDTYKAVNGVNRISGGTDRFDTNLKVLAAFKNDIKTDKVYVANSSGNGYADALAASVLAGKNSAPLVLVDNETSKATNNAIDYLKSSLTTSSEVKVLGGSGVLPESVVTKINNSIPAANSQTNSTSRSSSSSGGSGTANTETTVQNLIGYIIDQDCFDTNSNPGNETKPCLEMKSCAASGYGIGVPQKDGTYKFYYFDGAFAPNATGTQAKAYDLIDKSTKNTRISIAVTGKLNGDVKTVDGVSYPVITVSSLTEAPEPAEVSVVTPKSYEGWLSDENNAKNISDPTKISKTSLGNSDYGIVIGQSDYSFKFYKFDTEGQNLAKKNFLDKTTKDKDLRIKVNGILDDSTSTIKISTIEEEQELTGIILTKKIFENNSDPTKVKRDDIVVADSAASGYGVAVKGNDGKYKFYKFDEAGNKSASNVLSWYVRWGDNISSIPILVQGIVNGDSIIASNVIRERYIPGQLASKSLFNKDIALKDINKAALLTPESVASGYGYYIQSCGGHQFFPFDKDSNELIKKFIENSTTSGEIKVKPYGFWYWVGNNIKLNNIVEDTAAEAEKEVDEEISGVVATRSYFKGSEYQKLGVPGTITKDFLLDTNNAVSGYGIIYRTCCRYGYLRFDENGTKFIKDIINKSKKTSNIGIIVQGKRDADTIYVTNVVEAYDQTYSGTLVKTDAKGYGIKVKQEDGTYKFYKLSTKGDYYHESGQDQAKDFLSGLKKETTTVDVKGAFDGDSLVISSIKENLSITEAPQEQTFTGYIQDEDCFISYAPNYGDDTKNCLSMKPCAASGYGITALQSDGSYKFYYFDGDFATYENKVFTNGTGAQLSAWNLIQNTTKKNNITIKVTGKLNGNTKAAADGKSYPVITLSSLVEN